MDFLLFPVLSFIYTPNGEKRFSGLSVKLFHSALV